MKTQNPGRTKLRVSRISLGTVEIGLPYGIGIKELPSDAEAERILKIAVELGITYIDTARGYGVAEERIGKSGITKNDNIVVGTKCAQFLKQKPNLHGKELEQRIRHEIDTSRKNLRQDSLQLVQLHIESPKHTAFDELIAIMQKLIDEGKVQRVGIATRDEKAPLAALKTTFFETLQVAYSILDQRMASKILPQAQKQNIGIINRSVLLKGALTPAAEKLPETLTPLKKNVQAAAEIAAALGVDLPNLAIRFAASNPAISTILIGTVEPHHLETAIAAIEAGPLPDDVLTELTTLAIDDPSQIDPSQWPPL